MAKKNTKKLFVNVLKWIVSLLAIYYVFSNIDLFQLKQLCKDIHWGYLSLACLAFIFSKVSSSLRLTLFWRDISVHLTEWQNLKLYLLGMFYNLFLPGGIGGDAYKVWLLQRLHYAPVKPLTMAVLIDRVNGMVAILIMCLLTCFFLPIPCLCKGVILPLIALGYLFYGFLLKRYFPSFSPSIHLTTFYSLGVQTLQCISVYWIMRAIGVNESYWELMFVFMLSSVVAVLPFTIGGLGAREIVFLYGSQYLLIDAASAVTISLLFYVITLVVSWMGIYYYFFSERMNIKALPQ